MYLLGYDIGSSTIKTALMDAQTQEVLKVIQYPERDMDMISRQIGWAEQHPEIWWQHLCYSTQRMLTETRIDPKLIQGIGIAYQMHGLVLLDQDQQVLRPAIIWCDSRASSIGKQAFMEMGEDYCLRNLLNSPGNFTASKLKWVMDHEPRIFEQIDKVLLPGDYINMKLTGEVNTTISGLSECILWDYREKCISQDVLDYYQIPAHLFPDPVGTFETSGSVTSRASVQTGLVAGTPITYRAGDQPNNAMSLNVLNIGEIAATSGTSGVVYGLVDTPVIDPYSRVNAFTHVNYENNHDRIGILLCINGAGIQYSWIKNQIARSQSSYTDMDRMASSIPIGSEGICLLPFGNGSERIFEDRNVGSHIFNLRFNRHTRAHLYRAALEGVAFAFVHGIHILKDMGLSVDVIRVGNDNMFQSKIFSKTIATLLNSHIEVVDTTGAIGAARAAGVAVNIYNTVEDAFSSIKPREMHTPDLDYGMCSQAYSYWEANLEKILHMRHDDQGSLILRSTADDASRTIRSQKHKIATQALQINNQQRIIDQMAKELNQILSSPKKVNQEEQLQDLYKKVKSGSSASSSFEEFKQYYDEMNQDFIKSLNKKHPNLSGEELKLCTYLKLKMRTKEIAEKMNLSVRGVETKRYRLRQKFNLKRNLKLSDYLNSI